MAAVVVDEICAADDLRVNRASCKLASRQSAEVPATSFLRIHFRLFALDLRLIDNLHPQRNDVRAQLLVRTLVDLPIQLRRNLQIRLERAAGGVGIGVSAEDDRVLGVEPHDLDVFEVVETSDLAHRPNDLVKAIDGLNAFDPRGAVELDGDREGFIVVELVQDAGFQHAVESDLNGQHHRLRILRRVHVQDEIVAALESHVIELGLTEEFEPVLRRILGAVALGRVALIADFDLVGAVVGVHEDVAAEVGGALQSVVGVAVGDLHDGGILAPTQTVQALLLQFAPTADQFAVLFKQFLQVRHDDPLLISECVGCRKCRPWADRACDRRPSSCACPSPPRVWACSPPPQVHRPPPPDARIP